MGGFFHHASAPGHSPTHTGCAAPLRWSPARRPGVQGALVGAPAHSEATPRSGLGFPEGASMSLKDASTPLDKQPRGTSKAKKKDMGLAARASAVCPVASSGGRETSLHADAAESARLFSRLLKPSCRPGRIGQVPCRQEMLAVTASSSLAPDRVDARNYLRLSEVPAAKVAPHLSFLILCTLLCGSTLGWQTGSTYSAPRKGGTRPSRQKREGQSMMEFDPQLVSAFQRNLLVGALHLTRHQAEPPGDQALQYSMCDESLPGGGWLNSATCRRPPVRCWLRDVCLVICSVCHTLP